MCVCVCVCVCALCVCVFVFVCVCGVCVWCVCVCECGWVCRGALRRAHACHYLDLKSEDSPLLVEEKSRAEQASSHRMHTDMGVCAWQAQTKGEELFIYFT